MRKIKQFVGPMVAEWEDQNPLKWSMYESIGKGKRAEIQTYSFDFTDLQTCYSVDFLLELKTTIINRRLRVKLISIEAFAYALHRILKECQNTFIRTSEEDGSFLSFFININSDFLLCLNAIKDNISIRYLKTFIAYFRSEKNNPKIFEPDLFEIEFPSAHTGNENAAYGAAGRLRENILSTVLSRATLVKILNITEHAFENGSLTLDHFSYSRLLCSRAIRPESFRSIRLKDLVIDEHDGVKNYYLRVTIPKGRTFQKPIIAVRLHPDVGKILDHQRAAVAARLGHLVTEKNARISNQSHVYTIGDLPLFPAGVNDLTRLSKKTKDRLGVVSNSETFIAYYSEPLKKLIKVNLTHTAMRHTIGTQLAIAGASTATIAAVLLHSTYRSAETYVDLIFSGAIDELSDSLVSAFLEHFPVVREFSSVQKDISHDKKIVSTNTERTLHETTGECGRRQICNYAPITCYECPRFKPCYDADHLINLNRVNQELEAARKGGLARSIDVKRYTHIANRIRIVISACDAKREQISKEI